MMECTVRLYKLNMLPESILLMESEDPESARRRIPRPSNKARNSSAGSMLSRAFSRYYSLCFALVSRENDRGQKFALFSDHKGSLLRRQLVVVGGRNAVRLCAVAYALLAAQKGSGITVWALCWLEIATSAIV